MMESTTYKFAKNLKKRFGVIPHVTDKNYITNSYHVHVTEEIDVPEAVTRWCNQVCRNSKYAA